MANDVKERIGFKKIVYFVVTILTVLAAWSGFILGIWGTWIKEEVFPFQLVGSIGTITFGRLEDTQFLTISVPVSLSNTGEESGCIIDLGLKLKASKTKTEWTFFPAKVLKPGMYLSKPSGQVDIEGPWITVNLRGNQSFTQPVLFLHRPAGHSPGHHNAKDSHPLTVSDLRSNQNYKLHLYALTNNETCIVPDTPDYKLLASEDLTFQLALLKGLKDGIIPYFEIPFSKLDKIRESFILKLP